MKKGTTSMEMRIKFLEMRGIWIEASMIKGKKVQNSCYIPQIIYVILSLEVLAFIKLVFEQGLNATTRRYKRLLFSQYYFS